jgi:hypothetical protein
MAAHGRVGAGVIRFVDLTAVCAALDEERRPCCAFLDTATDSFVRNDVGSYVFYDAQEVAAVGYTSAVPADFWQPPPAPPSPTVHQRTVFAQRLAELLRPLPAPQRLGIVLTPPS